MKLRTKIYAISTITIVVILFIFVIYGLSPPNFPNETYIREGNNDWNLDNGQTVHGRSTWAIFADFEGDTNISRKETIKLYDCVYWGALLYDTDAMSWENEMGDYTSRSLTLNDLMLRWQDQVSVFKYKYGDEYYKVSFSIPKMENGTSKYIDLKDAWESGELYQTVEKW
jgi:hypothetical protein